jgi:hypoxanthine phosphoribosyltransferase
MSRKVFYKESTIKGWVHEIIRSMAEDDWRPDYVVGLTRGGLIPANMISQYLDVPMECLKVSLRDDNQCESNTWMAEDAFGYIPEEELKDSGIGGDGAFDYSIRAKNILIVDDINDTGATLNWIQQDWQTSCLPSNSRWENVWGNNVRTAVLIHNEASEFKDPDYTGLNINKHEDPQWAVFPWENWWAN